MKQGLVIGETIMLGLLGGLVFDALHIPLNWLLGPMFALILYTNGTKRVLYWPPSLFNLGLMILGYSLGTFFTSDMLGIIIKQLPLMIIVTTFTVAMSLAVGIIISRWSKMDLFSCLIGSVPGGLSQMVALGLELKEVNLTIITLMQTIRYLVVVFVVPFFILKGYMGGSNSLMLSKPANLVPFEPDRFIMILILMLGVIWVFKKWRVPTPFILGPMVVMAALVGFHIRISEMPNFLHTAGLILIGNSLGLSLKPKDLQQSLKIGAYSLIGGFWIVGFCFLLTVMINFMVPVSLITAFLSLAPGGMVEMGVTALEAKADLSLVMSYQLFRLFFIMFIVPYALKWLYHRYQIKRGNITMR